MTKVLIVEDEELIARMYQKALKFDDFEVSVAIGGEMGLKLIKEFQPDIVLLDIMMPEPNGIGVLEQIKADPDIKEIPIVMLTNLSGKHDAELALEKGASAFVVKSQIKVEKLGEKIRAILNEKSKSNSN
jgi:two-component system phosphate regulon response regulator PhoB